MCIFYLYYYVLIYWQFTVVVVNLKLNCVIYWFTSHRSKSHKTPHQSITLLYFYPVRHVAVFRQSRAGRAECSKICFYTHKLLSQSLSVNNSQLSHHICQWFGPTFLLPFWSRHLCNVGCYLQHLLPHFARFEMCSLATGSTF